MKGPGKFYQPAWVAMDYALDIARKFKIRLIIPIINNHNGGDQNQDMSFGDYGLLAGFRSLPPSAFYTSELVKTDFKNLLTYMLERINSVNGIRYSFTNFLIWR
jgi:mannan endo-1,4-beta-mannosidase